MTSDKDDTMIMIKEPATWGGCQSGNKRPTAYRCVTPQTPRQITQIFISRFVSRFR